MRRLVVGVVFALALLPGAGGSPAALADGQHRAVLRMPFDGGGTTGDELASAHHHYWYAWAWDLHGGSGTAVKPRVVSSDGAVTMSVASAGGSTCASGYAGQNVVVSVSVAGVQVGTVLFGHLDRVQVAAGQPVSPGSVLGYLATSTSSQPGGYAHSNCWQVTTASGIHTHVEVAQGCWRSLSTSTSVSASDPLIMLNAAYATSNRSACNIDEMNQVNNGASPPPTSAKPLLGVIDSGGNFYAKEGALGASWVFEAGPGAKAIAVASDPTNGPLLGVIDRDGTFFAKQGSLWAPWIGETGSGAKAIAVASDPTNGPLLGVIDRDGTFFAKQGSLWAPWIGETGSGAKAIAVASDPTNGPLLGVIDRDGTFFAKQGSLWAPWIGETGSGAKAIAVASDPTNGPLLGVIDRDGTFFAKQGSLWAPWIGETGSGAKAIAVASDPTNGPLLGVIDRDGTFFAKQGSLWAPWIGETGSGAKAIAVASDPTNGPLLGVIDRDGTFFAKEGALGATWIAEAGSGVQAIALPGSAATAMTVPAGPSGVTAVAGDASATVSWTPPSSDGGSPITGHVVTSSPGGVIAEAAGDVTRVVVGGLVNGTAYSFTVVASNAVGDSAPSVPSNVVTPGAGPTITSFRPASGVPGATVTILGSRLYEATSVRFGGVAGVVVSNAATVVKVLVPAGSVSGPVVVETLFGSAGSAGSFTVKPSPVPKVTSFSPGSGVPGAVVKISGSGLLGDGQVEFNGTAATILTNTASAIKVLVPAAATSGTLSVTTPGGTVTSTASFTVKPSPVPKVTSFRPTSGVVGASVTVYGSGLLGASLVSFNGAAATITKDAASSVKVLVPAGASSGPVSVTTPGGTVTSTEVFTVKPSPAPKTTGFSPTSGLPGTSVTLKGSGLLGASLVQFDGVEATITANSASTVKALVPATATTGQLSVTTAGGTATSTGTFTVE